jgi:hypothetical protein
MADKQLGGVAAGRSSFQPDPADGAAGLHDGGAPSGEITHVSASK